MFSRRDFMKQGLIPVFAGSAVPAGVRNSELREPISTSRLRAALLKTLDRADVTWHL